jgi:exodeoxyribonuclease VII small subunit
VKEEKLTYEKAYDELQEIISDIESGEISVDLLSEKVKRAAELIAFCKAKLTSTETDVQKILDNLKDQ